MMLALQRSRSSKKVFISAGDVSGDIHASGLIKKITTHFPGTSWFGLGGQSMEKAGCRLLMEPETESVMGFRRVLVRLPHYLGQIARIAEFLRRWRPDGVILADYPGMNLQIAKIAKSLDIPVIYFICPQYWAWAPWRIKKFSQVVGLALVIFPFEESYFQNHGVDTRYIGHPACDRKDDDPIESGEWKALPDGEILGLLPGSRRQELELHLPIMLNVASALKRRHPGLIPMLCHFRPELLDAARSIAEDQGVPLETRKGGMRKLARAARLCLVGSGTATLEVALTATPMVVIYKTSRLTRFLSSYLLTVPYFCQVNLLAGEELVPEQLISDEDYETLLSKALPLLEEGGSRDRMLARLHDFRERFFRPGALDRAAEAIVGYLGF